MSKRRRLTPVALTLTDCVSSVGHDVQADNNDRA